MNIFGCLYVQLQEGALAVREMMMVLVGNKMAPQRTWLPLLFHTIPVIESAHPPVFTQADSQQLLSRVQVTPSLPLLFQTTAAVHLFPLTLRLLAASVQDAHDYIACSWFSSHNATAEVFP